MGIPEAEGMYRFAVGGKGAGSYSFVVSYDEQKLNTV